MLSLMLCAKVRYVSNALGYQPPSAPHSRDRGSLRVNLNPCIYVAVNTRFCRTGSFPPVRQTPPSYASALDAHASFEACKRPVKPYHGGDEIRVRYGKACLTSHSPTRILPPGDLGCTITCNRTMTVSKVGYENMQFKKCPIEKPRQRRGTGGADSKNLR